MRPFNYASLFLSALLMSSCAKNLNDLKNLSQSLPVTNPTRATAYFDVCTLNPTTVKNKSKILIFIDESGSNAQVYINGIPAGYGTDVDGSRRFSALISYLNSTTVDDPDVQYGLVTFGGFVNTVFPYSVRSKFVATVTKELNGQGKQSDPLCTVRDCGYTNYIDALKAGGKMLLNDITLEQSLIPQRLSEYTMIFVSDGAPLNYDKNNKLINQDMSVIGPLIKYFLDQMDKNTGVVAAMQFNTGYYFTNQSNDPNASDFLNQMATSIIPGGVSYVFGKGASVDYSLFQTPQLTVKHALQDVIVTNTNVVWENGVLKKDTDGDGLSDDLETLLGSDPTKVDSDGNGVSDFVEYQISGKPCKTLTNGVCDPLKADPELVCAGLVNPNKTAGAPKYLDSDGDGLNDCEEKLIGSNMYQFDSHSIGINDGLAFLRGVSFLSGSNFSTSADPDGDGVNNYDEIKQNTPFLFSNTQIPNIQPYSYHVSLVSATATQSCYHGEVDNISFFDTTDTIQIWVTEGTTVVNTQNFLRTAKKQLTTNPDTGLVEVYFNSDEVK